MNQHSLNGNGQEQKPEKKKRDRSNRNTGNPNGRPKIVLDWEKIDKCLFIQCTLVEVAYVIGVSVDTLENRTKEEKGMAFSEYRELKSAGGKMSLRRSQWEHAAGYPAEYNSKGKVLRTEQKANTGMLIWLGKQYLEQKEPFVLTGKGGAPLFPSIQIKRDPFEELAEMLAKNKMVLTPQTSGNNGTGS